MRPLPDGMTIVTTGRNRFVILIGAYAVKIPSLRNWRDFLFGLLNNMNEAAWSSEPGHCPVIVAGPGGLFNVMPRARPLSDGEFQEEEHRLPACRAERKADSFGWLRGELVALDYGW